MKGAFPFPIAEYQGDPTHQPQTALASASAITFPLLLFRPALLLGPVARAFGSDQPPVIFLDQPFIHSVPWLAIVLLWLLPFVFIYPVLLPPFLLLNLIHIASTTHKITLSSLEDGEMNYSDLEYLYSRCSICFDSRLDFCLQGCKDQFCRACFQRYVFELVRSSWGLTVQKIKCPACNDILSKSEWAKYVDSKTVALYNQYNQPYRAFSRHCGSCGDEVRCAEQPLILMSDKQRKIEEIYALMESILKPSNGGELTNLARSLLARFQADYCTHMHGGSTSVMDVYVSTFVGVGTFVGYCVTESGRIEGESFPVEPSKAAAMSRLSSMFISLESNPDAWRDLQFLHVSNFGKAVCSCTQSLCFQCGESPYHENETCHQHLDNVIQRCQSERNQMRAESSLVRDADEHIANLKWKLAN
ncbi:hypothetical protein HK102_005596, partial [Quaeritorhiza haematococci]